MIVLQITPEELRTMIGAAVAEAMPKTITEAPKAEIIDRATLCKRLGISEPTAIRWDGRKGKIPVIRIGSAVRYDYNAVLAALQSSK